MKKEVWFVSGIDTNIGKTYATGLLARALALHGVKVITQKMVQTGCKDTSEDIIMHRNLQGIPPLKEDIEGLTCPYIFSYPASPHLAAEIDRRSIDISQITKATGKLLGEYELVLLEGAGGLMVPLDDSCLTLDYVGNQGYPVLLVTNGRLGSLNQTLLSLYACQNKGISVKALVYNSYPHTDSIIENDSLAYLRRHFPSIPVVVLDEWQGIAGGGALPDVEKLL